MESMFWYIFRFRGLIPHFQKLSLMFSGVNAFFQTSPPDNVVADSDFVNLLTCWTVEIKHHRKSFIVTWRQPRQGAEVQCSGNLMVVTFCWRANSKVPYQTRERCPSYIRSFGSNMPIRVAGNNLYLNFHSRYGIYHNTGFLWLVYSYISMVLCPTL